MPLEDLGSETVLNGIRNNGTKVRILGIYPGDDPNFPSYTSTVEDITWLSPTDASGTWTVTTNPLNSVTWLIEPEQNETLTIIRVEILDSNSIVVVSEDFSEPFERDGEFTLDQLIVAVQ